MITFKRIDALPIKQASDLSGSEMVLMAVGGANYIVSINSILTRVPIPTKTTVGLGSVDNTSDLAKPISTATQQALNSKAALQHTHSIAQVVGLQDALNSLMPITKTFTIADISGLQTALDSSVMCDQTDW